MITDPEFLAITDERERVASWATCSFCGKTYQTEPCDLVDHIEGHGAVMDYRKARERAPQSSSCGRNG